MSKVIANYGRNFGKSIRMYSTVLSTIDFKGPKTVDVYCKDRETMHIEKQNYMQLILRSKTYSEQFIHDNGKDEFLFEDGSKIYFTCDQHYRDEKSSLRVTPHNVRKLFNSVIGKISSSKNIVQQIPRSQFKATGDQVIFQHCLPRTQ